MLHLDYSKYRKPMVMAPHPDDLEGFTGGLVYQLPAKAISVVFAGGNQGIWDTKYADVSRDEYIQIRMEEAEEAAQILGVSEIVYMGYYDRQMECNEASINKALQQLRLHQPDLVISFEHYPLATPYPHPDHLATGSIVRHAIARYENRDKLDFIVCSTLLPNRFIDVTKVRRIKLEAMACHETQRGLNSIIFPFLEKMFSKLWGVYVGVDFAEGYRKVNVAEMIKRLERQQQREKKTPKPAERNVLADHARYFLQD